MRRGRKPKRGPHRGAKLKCKACGSVIQSGHVHDYVSCKCPDGTGIWIDGGAEYCRMGGADPTRYEIIDPGNYVSAD